MPVGFNVRATTMPPNNNAIMPSDCPSDLKMSACVRMPSAIRMLAPSSAASVMSSAVTAINRITPANTPSVM